MTPRPSRPTRVLSTALAAGVLLGTAACSQGGGAKAAGDAGVTASPAARKQPSSSPAAVLTEAGARTALITEADIEDDWTQVKDSEAENWNDSLLVGTVDVSQFLTGKSAAADCQRLTDSLFDEDLLGKPSGASALRGFTQDDSRLLYQVAAYDRGALQDSLDRMAKLPSECDQFTLDSGGRKRTVQVVETSLPSVGDARQGLRVTVRGSTGGQDATLTLDVAVVRVGDNAITVTAGGLAGGEEDSVKAAVQQGTPRLEDVLAGKSPAPTPSGVD
ncbi:lipoprotein [Streptomyces zinciresistens K42]|uniref:Lipoprotein n=1 Tax=Streptomyces zinciresistens K42 TaxID=700597 RepID=G2GFY8_9ACTN|nr:hypothetical protein [Streptomyces zinciresistens]EGX57567.1 lipoprotein [Streptomyces zinciresistens K42]